MDKRRFALLIYLSALTGFFAGRGDWISGVCLLGGFTVVHLWSRRIARMERGTP